MSLSTPDRCPKCNADMDGGEIPEAMRHNYSSTNWSRCIAIYDRDLDCTVAWRCPDCGHEWGRDKPADAQGEKCTDPKEAAIQRLAEAIVAYWDGNDPRLLSPMMAQAAARIAIEQGVVPAVKADRASMILPAEIRKDLERWDHVFPWGAVCAGEPKPPRLT